MRFLVISKGGAGLGVAMHLSAEGHKVTLYVDSHNLTYVGEGIIEKRTMLNPLVHRGMVNDRALKALVAGTFDVVVIVGVGLGALGSRLAKEGYRVIGANQFSDNLHSNEGFRGAVLEHLGGTYMDTGIGYQTRFLEWFNGSELIPGWFIVRTYSSLMDGDLGPQVGCSGSVVKMLDRVCHSFTRDFLEGLKISGYVGPVWITIHGDGNFTPVDVGCHIHMGMMSAVFELMQEPLGEFLFRLEGLKTIRKVDEVAISVLLSRPPFPFSNVSKEEWKVEIEPGALKHLWLMAAVGEEDGIYMAGNATKLGYVTAFGNGLREARRRVYRTIQRMKNPGIQYRLDIGEGIEK